jgi:hypothetical protein
MKNFEVLSAQTLALLFVILLKRQGSAIFDLLASMMHWI